MPDVEEYLLARSQAGPVEAPCPGAWPVAKIGHEQHEQSLLLSAIPGLVEGMDVASARLAIAGLGLHTAVLAEIDVVAHG